jgi:hypothetical protein
LKKHPLFPGNHLIQRHPQKRNRQENDPKYFDCASNSTSQCKKVEKISNVEHDIEQPIGIHLST